MSDSAFDGVFSLLSRKNRHFLIGSHFGLQIASKRCSTLSIIGNLQRIFDWSYWTNLGYGSNYSEGYRGVVINYPPLKWELIFQKLMQGELTLEWINPIFLRGAKIHAFLQFCTVKLIFFRLRQPKKLEKRPKLANLGWINFWKNNRGGN